MANGLEWLLGPRDAGSSPDRNPVLVDALRKRLGLGQEAPNVMASQADTEDAADALDLMPKSGAEKLMDAQSDDLVALDHAQAAAGPTFQDALAVTNRAKAAQEGAVAAAKQAPETAGALALEHQKGVEERATMDAQADTTRDLLGGGGGHSGGGMGTPGSWKPSINAKGQVAFSQTQMPALVQRAYNQLSSAYRQTASAIDEVTKQYPGIDKEADTMDMQQGGGLGSALGRFFGTVTGLGAPKYGGPSDFAAAGMDRLNYTLGIPTPFAKLAQEASFGNIEQMAGQLPGVRGLATITPLFKEHQSRWGHETPLATMQRLMHMKSIMEQTLEDLRTGGGGPADGSEQ